MDNERSGLLIGVWEIQMAGRIVKINTAKLVLMFLAAMTILLIF
jgi:hypothetical protein